MHQSHTIARLVGPLMAVVGVGMLANGDVYRGMAEQFLVAYPFIYFSGVMLLLGGLLILNMHNVWTSDWRSIITALGWIATCIGAFRIFAPQFANFIGTGIIAHTGFFIGAGVVLLALGGYLTFKGYAA